MRFITELWWHLKRDRSIFIFCKLLSWNYERTSRGGTKPLGTWYGNKVVRLLPVPTPLVTPLLIIVSSTSWLTKRSAIIRVSVDTETSKWCNVYPLRCTWKINVYLICHRKNICHPKQVLILDHLDQIFIKLDHLDQIFIKIFIDKLKHWYRPNFNTTPK